MCLISSKNIESLAILEDKDYIGVLDINPLSEGHTILIPKKHLKESKLLKSKAFTTAKKIGKHLVKKLNAENYQINTSDELGHAIINIIPLYKDKKINTKREPADKKKLQETAIKIGKIEKIIKVKTDKPKEKQQVKQSKEITETKKSLGYTRIP